MTAITSSTISVRAIEITRYVAQNGTGQGLSEDDPSGNLQEVLSLSNQVDRLTLYLAPGEYNLPLADSYDGRPKYGDILLFGGWENGTQDTDRKAIIRGELNINGGLVSNIDFRHESVGDPYGPGRDGSLEVTNANLYYVKATRLDCTIAGNVQYLIVDHVDANMMSVSTRRSVGRPVLYLDNSTFTGSKQHGFFGSGVQIWANNCEFSDNDEGGMSLGGCTGSVFTNCKFMKNRKNGGICVSDVSDNITVTFQRCVISSNITSNPDQAAAVTPGTPILMKDCLIANNYSTIKDKGIKPYLGAIELGRKASRFHNCTFYKNHCVLFYWMYPADQNVIDEPQFMNCLFLENGLSYISVNGCKPWLGNCAADFSSGIPELDAERGNIIVTKESAKVDIVANEEVFVNEGSPLINAGDLYIGNDLTGNNRFFLGGTDIGCEEYTSIWRPVEGTSNVKIGDAEYISVSTQYDGKTYYGLAPLQNLHKDSGIVACKGLLYIGENAANYKILDDRNAVTYLNVNDRNIALLQNLNSEIWNITSGYGYDNIRPTAVKEGNKWVLKEGRQSSAKTGTTKSTARKSAARKTTSKRR